MMHYTGWRYWWRRYFGWFPFQTCAICRRWYWGGLPRFGWRAWYQDYCSRGCADVDLELCERTRRPFGDGGPYG